MVQPIGLTLSVHDLALHFACQSAVHDLQFVRMGEIETEALFQTLGEEHEAAGDQQGLDAVFLQFG